MCHLNLLMLGLVRLLPGALSKCMLRKSFRKACSWGSFFYYSSFLTSNLASLQKKRAKAAIVLLSFHLSVMASGRFVLPIKSSELLLITIPKLDLAQGGQRTHSCFYSLFSGALSQGTAAHTPSHPELLLQLFRVHVCTLMN